LELVNKKNDKKSVFTISSSRKVRGW